MLAGERIGFGIGRQVWSCVLNPAWVVKTEEASRSFQNVTEWIAWERVQDTVHRRWFAPCRFISSSGVVLVQDRTTPCPVAKLPKRMPVFLADFKPENFGLLNGRVVCHDYGTHRLFERGMTKAMRSVKW